MLDKYKKMRTLKFIILFICVLLTQQLRAQMFTSPFQAVNYQKVISNGLNFDGTNDFINITRPVTDDFTIEFWVKTSQTPASGTQWYSGSLIIDGEVAGVTNDFGIGLNGTKLAFGIGNPDYSIISNAVINDGTWKHVAVTRKKSTGAINIYINGVSDVSGTASNVNSLTAPSMLKIGGPNSIGSFFNGTLDDIRFWNYVRTVQQISGSMNNEMLGSEVGLVAYYNFNQGRPNVSNAGVSTLFNETSSLGTYNGTLTNFSLSGGTSNWVVGKLEPLIPTNNLRLYVDAGKPRSYAGSGSVMTDLSPSGNNMTLYNSPTFYSDYGGNLNFNGTNTYLQSIANSAITGASPRTVCIWYNPTTITNGVGTLLWTGNESVANSTYGIGFSGGKYQFWGMTNDFTDATLAPTTNTWNFIAAAYGGGTSVYQYLNGTGNLNSISNALTTTAGSFIFSKNGGTGFTGKLGNIMVFDRMLTKTDLDKLYFNIKSRIPDGLTPQTAAISGLQLHYDYPSYSSGWYWIKSAIMPNALQMYVDMTEDGGGYDFYPITAGPSVNYVNIDNGGTPLGLDIVYPRSKYHWRAMSNAVNTIITAGKNGGGNYASFFQTTYGIYRTTSAGSANGGNYTTKVMRSSDYGGPINALDWQVKDNGGWWLRDAIFGEPNGDYYFNGFMGLQAGGYTMPNPYTLNDLSFNDGNTYATGNYYLVSTNAKKIAPDGRTIATAATSAKAIKTAYPTSPDGVYYINLPTVGIQPVYCLMDNKYDGGGWMMAMKATRGATFNYDANYWYTANTLNPLQTNQADGDAKFDVFNYFGTTDMMALWPDIQNVGSESGSIDNLTTWSWLEKNITGAPFTLINKFSSSPTQQAIYTNTNGSMTFNGFGSPFSNQIGFTFYGFNYSYSANERVRWGFAWNNETDQNSNDVRGGIGLKYVSYSAGDHIGCCNNQLGINRTARVEMYVR